MTLLDRLRRALRGGVVKNIKMTIIEHDGSWCDETCLICASIVKEIESMTRAFDNYFGGDR